MRTLGIALLLLAALTPGFTAAEDTRPVAGAPGSGASLGLVTGPRGGTYIAFGHDIAQAAAKDGLAIPVYESRGSIDNIERIAGRGPAREKAGLAIVQSDVLGFLKRSQNPDSVAEARKLRLIAPFYHEEVHILARDTIRSLADLGGRKVVVGSAGSGSMITAVNLFSTLGIAPAKLYEVDPPHGIVAVLDGQVDAVVFVGGKPVKMFKNMEALARITGPNAGKLDHVHFLPVSDARLLKEYRPATLTAEDYRYVKADVPTVAVTAVLVTYDYTSKNGVYYREGCRNVARLARSLRDHLSELKATGHPKWKEVDLSAEVGIWKRDACSLGALSAGPEGNAPSLEKDLLGVVRGQAQ